ncbi:universal stress protein [Myxococcota bacterium]|nr:universal stress protein [Myxococcota bacterium]MBU1430841.1 universal stress protein [Myxococcota bacterium]MBU1897354.1 universal stress protein [Myxococcota bacterium]
MSFLPKKTILVPLDFSEESLAALGQATEMIAEGGALHALHVLNHLHAEAPPGVDEAKRVAQLEDKLKRRTAAFKGLICHVRVGAPGPEIAKLAEAIGADLVVMPTHSRTGLASLGLGSVAEQVVRLAPCSVLIIR